MALGDFKLFQWKSKKQLEKEQKEYAVWAFPHGELQKTKLTELMRELKPKEQSQMLLVSFLTCKEFYESKLEGSEASEEAVIKTLLSAKTYRQIIKQNDLAMYLAIVLADAGIDENCEYPSADEIRERAKELDELRKSK